MATGKAVLVVQGVATATGKAVLVVQGVWMALFFLDVTAAISKKSMRNEVVRHIYVTVVDGLHSCFQGGYAKWRFSTENPTSNN